MKSLTFKLCFVDRNFAYFTTQDVKKQWGDGWDDAPIELNASPPYESEDGSWAILKVSFDVETFDSRNTEYENLSVMDINQGAAPWLNFPWRSVRIDVGTTLKKFESLIKKAKGEVYFKKSDLQKFDLIK